jgi:hypothetical protein
MREAPGDVSIDGGTEGGLARRIGHDGVKGVRQKGGRGAQEEYQAMAQHADVVLVDLASNARSPAR